MEDYKIETEAVLHVLIKSGHVQPPLRVDVTLGNQCREVALDRLVNCGLVRIVQASRYLLDPDFAARILARAT